jgi:hypothetical protein
LLILGILIPGSQLFFAVNAGAAPAAPTPGSPAYIARDVQNMVDAFGRQTAADGQLQTPDYLVGLAAASVTASISQFGQQLSNPTRPVLTLAGALPPAMVGNPLRANWANTRGQMVPVAFTARDGALLRGNVFAPLAHARDPYTGVGLSPPYPGVVIVTGSIQSPSGAYTWLAQDLAERGYVVLTFDVQGQGASETLPHQGSNPDLPSCGAADTVSAGQVTPCAGVPSEQQQNFDDSTQDAMSFFLSTPAAPYPNFGAGSAAVDRYNPLWSLYDHSPDTNSATPGRTTRLALIGHSTGAVTVSYLQGVDPRIETIVAMDKLTATPDAIKDDQAELGALPGPVVPQVPALGLQSEYGFEPQPYWLASCSSFVPCPLASGSPVAAPALDQPPDPTREEATGFNAWRHAGVDSMVVVPRASTHLEYSDVPLVLPASQDGQAMASYYTQAWLAKYLRHDPAAGFALLATSISYLKPGTNQWTAVQFTRDDHLSFYFCSGYDFHVPAGQFSNPDIIGAGCT